MGKGDKRRPVQVSRQEENLRWKLALGRITFEEYKHRRKKLIEQNLWGHKGKLRYR